MEIHEKGMEGYRSFLEKFGGQEGLSLMLYFIEVWICFMLITFEITIYNSEIKSIGRLIFETPLKQNINFLLPLTSL